jgi:hypothetical protein
MAIRKRGLQFENEEDFKRVLRLFDDLASEGPLEYNVAWGVRKPTIVLVEWSYDRAVPVLQEHNIPYAEVRVRPMSDLAPEEQARLRGWKREDESRE